MADWSNPNAKLEGDYTFIITDAQEVTREDKNSNPPKQVKKYKFTLKLHTGQDFPFFTNTAFMDPASITKPEYTPMLMRLVKALRMPMPTTKEEALAWDPRVTIGKSGRIIADGVTIQLMPAPTASAPVVAPPPPPPVDTPPQPYQPVNPSAFQPPPAPPTGAPIDPFADQ